MKVCTTCGAEYGEEKLFCERDGTPLRKSGAAGDLVGQVIAERYHITRKLGEGGMGQVYLAEHVKMGRRCAIKIMTPGTMTDPDAISRFNREAANASRISHPNVCAIYDFGETPDGLIYLAMEFIEGKSLTDLLLESTTLPLPRSATMIQQCAEALQVAHDLGIVHRDLKPDNIMVTTTRGRDTVKVVDFGIAKAMAGEEGGRQKVTKTGFVVGTPEYMSPEQLAGDPVDGRSDIYSLGLVFYRMLTGASPFPADSQQETMIKRLTDDPLPLAVARPDVRFPPEVQKVFDRALARQPSQRYANASDLARDVRNLATRLTGTVDVDAGTQVVRAEELKAAVPATRVDPLAAKERARAPAATQPARAVPARRGVPILPIAAVGVLLAASGGAYAMRDRLFGTGGTAATPADTAPPRTDDTATTTVPGGTRPQANPDTTPATGTRGGTAPGGTPAGGGPASRRDTVVVPVNTGPDVASLDRQLTVFYDDIDFVDDDGKRGEAMRLGKQIFGTSAAPATLRARAAFVVAQAYIKEQNISAARQWMDEALKLDSSHASWKQIRDQL
jgi:serine/threonine-protein kinase